MSEERDGPDSFVTGLTTVAKSRKGRSILKAIAPYLAGAAVAALPAGGVGYVIRSVQLEPRVVKLEASKAEQRESLERIERNLLELRAREQQHLLQVGRQAAYATTCCETGEPRKLLEGKRKEARSDAQSYENLVLGGKDPEFAYTSIAGQ